MTPTVLLEKWSRSGAAESSNAQSFTNDLCDLLGVAHPDPTTPVEADNAYVFEKRVTGRNGNTKFIDCYKRGHFVLENKQGANSPLAPKRGKPSLEPGGQTPPLGPGGLRKNECPLPALPRPQQLPHQTGRFGKRGHPRTPPPHLDRPPGPQPRPQQRPRHEGDRRLPRPARQIPGG